MSTVPGRGKYPFRADTRRGQQMKQETTDGIPFAAYSVKYPVQVSRVYKLETKVDEITQRSVLLQRRRRNSR